MKTFWDNGEQIVQLKRDVDGAAGAVAHINCAVARGRPFTHDFIEEPHYGWSCVLCHNLLNIEIRGEPPGFDHFI